MSQEVATTATVPSSPGVSEKGVAPVMLGPSLGRGFVVSLMWGLRQTLMSRRFGVAAGLSAVGGYLLGSEGVGASRWNGAPDPIHDVWGMLDNPILPYVLPIVAMFVVSGGFSKEVSQRTLVYHLVRPISRSTLFVSRFIAGVIPAILISMLLIVVFIMSSGVSVPASFWGSIPLTATFGVLAIGAVYYTLAALHKTGTIQGLVYTFAFDPLFASTKGSMQKLSVMYHVRSLHHQLTDAFFVEKSSNVRNELERDLSDKLEALTQTQDASKLLELSETIAWSTPSSAMINLTLIAVVAIAFGCWRMSKRDFALKD